MEEHAIKIKRSKFAIKLAMAFIVLMEAVTFYQTNIINLGSIATAAGLLALLRGLLLSPLIYNTPVKHWFTQNVGFNSDSYKYFLIAFILLFVGLLKYV